MIVYTQERLADIKPDIEALVPQQWAEMAQGFGGTAETPQWDIYLALEQQQKLILLTARSQTGELLGYFGAFYYTVEGRTAWRSTPYYVVPCRPIARRALILRRLVKMMMARTEGNGFLIKTHPWASAAPILEHLGFRAVETWYMLEKLPPAKDAPDA